MKILAAEFERAVGSPDQIPDGRLPEIAFSGRSNVGKSSLLNRLLNRKSLARISNTPGKTRTLNYYCVNNEFYLVDLPGYGYAKRSQQERKSWGHLIDHYLQDRPCLKGFIQLLDARHDPTQDDMEMIAWLAHAQKPFLVLATKSDKLSGNKLQKQLKRTREFLKPYKTIDLLPFSAPKGRGRLEVWRWIQEAING